MGASSGSPSTRVRQSPEGLSCSCVTANPSLAGWAVPELLSPQFRSMGVDCSPVHELRFFLTVRTRWTFREVVKFEGFSAEVLRVWITAFISSHTERSTFSVRDCRKRTKDFLSCAGVGWPTIRILRESIGVRSKYPFLYKARMWQVTPLGERISR